jgi:hypothetical protein
MRERVAQDQLLGGLFGGSLQSPRFKLLTAKCAKHSQRLQSNPADKLSLAKA